MMSRSGISRDAAEFPAAYDKEEIAQPGFGSDGAVKEKSFEVDSSAKESSSLEPPEGGKRAWFVACGAAGVLFCTSGYVNAFGVYQEYYTSHQLQDATASAISWIGSIQMFFMFGAGLFGGPLFDLFGGKVIWPPAAIFVFSVMMTSLCKVYYQFMLAQGILGGMSMGLMMAPALASTAQYFNKNRGAAMGIVVAGSSLGGVIFPIALSRMFNSPRLGFGWAVRICGFLMLAVLGFSCVSIRARLPPRKRQFFQPAAFKELTFTTLVVAVFLICLGIFTPFFYLPTYATSHGMSPQLASYLISVLNGTSFFGRLIPGILADRAGPLNMLYLFSLAAGIIIFCWQTMSTNASIIVFSALYGFFSGAIISLMSVSIANIADNPRNIGTYMGMGMFVLSFAVLAGPPINGVFVAHFGGYDQAQIFSGVVVLVGAFVILLAKHVSGKGLCSKI